MPSAILAYERTTHPLLLHCLQDLDHDWRRLQLVNTAMCTAFWLHKDQVAAHTAKREQLCQDCTDMSAELGALINIACSLTKPFDVWAPRILRPPKTLTQLWAEFDTFVGRAEPVVTLHVESVVFAVRHIYVNNIFDATFVRGGFIRDLCARPVKYKRLQPHTHERSPVGRCHGRSAKTT
jgi:hypothetical protein